MDLFNIDINDFQTAVVQKIPAGSFITAIMLQINKINSEFKNHQLNEMEFCCLIADFIRCNDHLFSKMWEEDIKEVVHKILPMESGVEVHMAQAIVELFQTKICFYQKKREVEVIQPNSCSNTNMLTEINILFTFEDGTEKFYSIQSITNKKSSGKKESGYNEQPRNELYKVKEYESGREMMVKKIKGDGNCFIRAIIDQMNKSEDYYRCNLSDIIELRNKIANHMNKNRERYEMYLIESLEENGFLKFIEDIRKPGVYLGHESMVAVTEIFDKCILLYQTDSETLRIGEEKDREEDVLRLLYTGENGVKNHFDSIRIVKGQTEENTGTEKTSVEEVKEKESYTSMHGKHNDDSEEISTIRYRKTQDTPITGKQIKETGKLVQEEGKQWQWNKERNNQKKSDDKKAVEKNMDERGNETRKITREKHKPINKDRAITKDFITDNRKEEILDLEEKRRRQRSKEREDRLEQLATQIKTNEERSMLINGSQRQGWEENDSQERLDREKQAKTDKNTRGRIQMDVQGKTEEPLSIVNDEQVRKENNTKDVKLGDKKENPRISTKQRNDRKRAKNERVDEEGVQENSDTMDGGTKKHRNHVAEERGETRKGQVIESEESRATGVKATGEIGEENEEVKESIMLIATLNIRGCSKLEKRQEIDNMLESFNIDVAALQEVNVKAELITTRNYEWRIGGQGQNKSRGLAILIRKDKGIDVMEWKEIGKYGLSISLLSKGRKIILINVHGPNKNGYIFYSSLGKLISQDHLRSNLIMVGDWNAQIGKDSVMPEDAECIGNRLGFSNNNDNGEEFKMFLTIHKIKNMSTVIGKNTDITWKSGKKESQIDHVLKPREGKIEIRFIKGYWTGINTDHKMIVTGIRTREKENKEKGKKKIPIDASVLKYDTIKEKYQEALKKYEIRQEKGNTIELDFKAVAGKMKKAANEVLRSARAPLTPIRKAALNKLKTAINLSNKHPDIFPYRWKLKDRRMEFQAAIRSHNERKIKKFYKELNDFDVAVRIKKSYQFLKGFLKRKKHKNVYIPMSQWNEALKESEGPEIQLMDEHDTCPVTVPPKEEEMMQIVQQQCNGKSAGADGIRMELLKYADKQTQQELADIWKRVWIENHLPEDMEKTIQVPIPKNAKAKGVQDFRRISLCNVAYKPYAKWIKQRLREFTGEPDINQAAFTEGRSTDDHMFVTRRILEEYWNAGNPLYVAALDISKAFDNVSLLQLRSILAKLNVPSHLIDRVLQCIRKEKIRVRWQNQYTTECNRGKGVKQGCPLSPFLFNIVMQNVVRKVKEKVPELNLMNTGSLKLPMILIFADDILIITKDEEGLKRILIALEESLREVGLEINNDKSQILIRAPNATKRPPNTINLNGRNYDVKTSMRYLGAWLTDTLNRPATTKQRCVNAAKVSKLVVEFCKKFKPTWEIGKLIYNTVIAPSILYGTKTATLTKRSRVQLGKYEKQILKDIWNQCRKTDERKFNVRKELKGKTINRRVRVNRISYYGHIQRREETHPIKMAMKLKFNKKKHGRPSFTWKKSLEQDFNRYNGITEEEWSQIAQAMLLNNDRKHEAR